MIFDQRVEIAPLLYRLQADLAVLYMKCFEQKALALGASVSAMKVICDEAILDLKPDSPDIPLSVRLHNRN
jgi:hypothetical protein